MKMKKIIFSFSFLIFTLLFFNESIFADQQELLFDQGNQSYQNGDYETALKSYKEILQMGFATTDLYYNLGNTYFKLGQNSKAILNYERALRLQPNDEDIQFNLQILNLSVVDKIPQIPELFHIKYFKQFRSLFSIRILTIISLIFYMLFFIALILWLISEKSKLRIIFKYTFLTLLIVLIVFSFTFVSKILYLQKNVEAIVMSPQVDVLSAPSESGTQIFSIHDGLKVKITNTRDEWYEIRLPDGKEGWLQVKDVEVI
jgi:tetratricopeptide (TPR) repeat protein